MTPEEIRALIVSRNEAVSRRDSPGVMTAYSDDCVVESPIMGTLIGHKAIQKSFELFWISFPDVSYEFDDPLIAEDRVVQTLSVHGTNTGGLLGQAPTGKLFHFFVVILFTLKAGKITHERRVYDFSGFLRELAGEAGHTEESAKLYRDILASALLEQEIRVAADIQQALLPPTLYKRMGLEVAATSVPCRAVGGDFFDYFDLPNDMFGFVLGDVAGKGPPAALLAGIIQGCLAGQAQLGGPALSGSPGRIEKAAS